MTERHSGYIITLQEDVREDDAVTLIRAISLFGQVASITPITSTVETHLAMGRRDQVWRERLMQLMREMPNT